MSIPEISVTDMRAIIEDAVDNNDIKPLLFLGKTGIGKSETPRLIAEERGLGHIDIRILNHSETDFKGLPYPDQERKFTVYLQNKIFPRVEVHGERGLLVFDEVTSGYRSVRTAIYQLLQERCLGEYKLPEGWHIICLGNGEDDGGDFNGMESAFGARCRCFRVTSTLNDYLEYGNKRGVNDLVLSFLEFSPSSLHTYNPEYDGSEQCLGFACNRAWSSVSDLLNRKGVDLMQGTVSNIDRKLIKGTIGELIGSQFLTFVDLKRDIISCVDIVKGKEVPEPRSKEIKYMTANGVKNLMAELTDQSPYKGDEDDLSNELMTTIANGMLWAINHTNIEIATSVMIGYCNKAQHGTALFISEKFDNFCNKSPKFKQINDFLEKHNTLFSYN